MLKLPRLTTVVTGPVGTTGTILVGEVDDESLQDIPASRTEKTSARFHIGNLLQLVVRRPSLRSGAGPVRLLRVPVGFTIVWPEGVIFGSIMTYHVQFLLLVRQPLFDRAALPLTQTSRVLPPLSVGKMTLRLYGALNYSHGLSKGPSFGTGRGRARRFPAGSPTDRANGRGSRPPRSPRAPHDRSPRPSGNPTPSAQWATFVMFSGLAFDPALGMMTPASMGSI